MKPITRETIIDRRQPQIRWGAVFAGAAVSVGLWILLQTLGMGAGLAALDTNDAGNLRSVGIGTTVWSLIAPLIALFVGGLIAGRLAGTRVSRVGSIHGLVMWSITSVLGVFMTVWVISTLAGGALKIGGVAANAAGSAVSSATDAAGGAGGAMSSLGLDVNDLLGPVNQKLQQQGKPAVTAEQLKQSVSDVAKKGLNQGHLDREMLVQSLAANTALSHSDVEDLATQIEDRYNRVAARVQDVGNQAEHIALQAAEKTGKGLLWAGLALLLGLFASVGGGAIGARPHDKDERTGGGGGRRTTEYPVVPPVTTTSTTGSTIITEP